MEYLAKLEPFDILDAEAARLDRFFSGLDPAGWERPSRCEGWAVRDVLAHLAGEELYNHACLDDDLQGLFELIEDVGRGLDGFNDWCVRERRALPVEEVLDEWRGKSAETRRRMRELGRDALMPTSVGPYPVGLQAFHFASEYATHADDVGVPITAEEARDRTHWRVRVGLYVLRERDRKVRIDRFAPDERLPVRVGDDETSLSPEEFVEATVGRLDDDRPVVTALRCLA